MTNIEIDALRQHIGTMQVEEDVATAAPPHGMIMTFDRDEEPPKEGEAIAPGWHRCYFLPMSRPSRLGADGLPLDSGVMPAMPLPRRMFAGTKTTFHKPIRVGDKLTRETELADIQLREGSTGVLIFTNVVARIIGPDGLALEEEARTAFRDEVKPGEKSGIPKRETPPSGTPWERTITADPVSLFRYSALTFNPHRIHYDRPYAMEVEGYPGLVIHGPYSSQCLLDLARDNSGGRAIKTYEMRARAPLFDTAPFKVVGRPTADGNGCELWALTPEGTTGMTATATFA
jgi:3-methylfumaryl-CoA hydratase